MAITAGMPCCSSRCVSPANAAWAPVTAPLYAIFEGLFLGAISAMYDARFFRMWEFYLSGGVVAFESGSMCNFQAQYIRDRNALPITRDYMIEAERKYRAS